MRAALALLLVAFAALGPQLFLPEWRGTEARRVEIAREMVASGDWMVPTLGGEPTLAKPPLYYWMLAAVQQFDDSQLAMRLPSLLGFWLLALMCFVALRKPYGEAAAWVSSLGILLSPLVLDHAAYAEIDCLFAVLTGLSILWLAEGASYGRRGKLILGGVLGGLALLTKGPPYFLFLAGTSLVWLRRLKFRGLVWYLLPLVLLPLGYYVPLISWHVPYDELLGVAGVESVGRLETYTLEHVIDTPLYFLRAIAVLLPLGLWSFHEHRGSREMRRAVLKPEEAFLRMCAGAMVAAIPLLAVFPGRSARYLLPGIACFTIALGPGIAAYMRYRDEPSLMLSKIIQVLGVVGSLGLIASPWIPFPFDARLPIFLAVLAIGPALIRNRKQIVAYVLLVPFLGAWTVLLDRADRKAVPPQAQTAAAEALFAEVDRLGVDDVATYGHVPSELLLVSPESIAADEFQKRTPDTRWLIVEDPDHVNPALSDPHLVEGYRDRVRVRTRHKSIVLKERE